MQPSPALGIPTTRSLTPSELTRENLSGMSSTLGVREKNAPQLPGLAPVLSSTSCSLSISGLRGVPGAIPRTL